MLAVDASAKLTCRHVWVEGAKIEMNFAPSM
jgi:hypothetical protein